MVPPQLLARRQELQAEVQKLEAQIQVSRNELELLMTKKLMLAGAFAQLEEVLKLLEGAGTVPVPTPDVPAIPGA